MSYDVSITRLDQSALFDLKGDAGDVGAFLSGAGLSLPKKNGSYSPDTSRTVLAIGPDHWLVRAPLSDENTLCAGFENVPDMVSCVLVSDVYRFYRIEGPDAVNALSVAVPLDLHPTAFPKGSATFTDVFETHGLLLNTGAGFEIATEHSYVDLLAVHWTNVVGKPVAA